MGLWTNDYKVCKADVILEQLEERIVLDGAVEASANYWDGPDPGNGIWDGATHVIDGTSFNFQAGVGGGVGCGYWWNPDVGNWGWAFDYESGWWWENTGSGESVAWDWMNVGWWDFELYANQGICAFDEQARTDAYGVTMQYDQAGEEMVYTIDGANYMKYEMDPENDTDWGWYWWDSGTGQGVWDEWEDGAGNPYALLTNSYSGFSSEFLYDNSWRPLPGGHGADWVFFDYSETFGEGGTYYFWLDNGPDFSIDYTTDATATPAVWGTGGYTVPSNDWQYIGSSLFSFEKAGPSWSIYDGTSGVNDEWFEYFSSTYTSSGFGNWDFNSTTGEFNLAFLSGKDNNETTPAQYSDNTAELIDNCCYILGVNGGGGVSWDYDGADFGSIVNVVGAISQSQGNQYLGAVMFHGQGWTAAGGIAIGGELFDAVGDVDAAEFGQLAGYLMGSGAEVQIMNSDAAASTAGTDILTAMQTALTGGPWGTSGTIWASDDVSGTWSGVADTEPNWFLEWDGSGGTDPLNVNLMLYQTDYTNTTAADLVGDVTTT